MLKEKHKTRKKIKIESIETVNCCNKPKTTKEIIAEKAIDFIDNCLDITNFLKLRREFEVLKKIILNKNQRNHLILPSYNSNNAEFKESCPEEVWEIEEINDKVSIEAIEEILNLDFSNPVNRKIAKNIIKSII